MQYERSITGPWVLAECPNVEVVILNNMKSRTLNLHDNLGASAGPMGPPQRSSVSGSDSPGRSGYGP